MDYIDPHIHMISRVTDDYQRMAQCGCQAVSEPAFWAGFDRGSADGFWCGMTLYPTTKCTPERAVDIIEMVGTDRIMANSAGDWGRSNPLAVPELILEMKRRGHPAEAIRKVVYENPLTYFRQSRRWQEWDMPGKAEKGETRAARPVKVER